MFPVAEVNLGFAVSICADSNIIINFKRIAAKFAVFHLITENIRAVCSLHTVQFSPQYARNPPRQVRVGKFCRNNFTNHLVDNIGCNFAVNSNFIISAGNRYAFRRVFGAAAVQRSNILSFSNTGNHLITYKTVCRNAAVIQKLVADRNNAGQFFGRKLNVAHRYFAVADRFVFAYPGKISSACLFNQVQITIRQRQLRNAQAARNAGLAQKRNNFIVQVLRYGNAAVISNALSHNSAQLLILRIQPCGNIGCTFSSAARCQKYRFYKTRCADTVFKLFFSARCRFNAGLRRHASLQAAQFFFPYDIIGKCGGLCTKFLIFLFLIIC